MRKRVLRVAAIGLAFASLVVLGQNCGSAFPVAGLGSAQLSSGGSPQDLANLVQGKVLYEKNCSGCHGNVAGSPKIGADAARITAAIGRVPQMSHLQGALTAPEIAAIATALQRTNEVATCKVAPDVGNVVMHRLNSVEYDNTIRDLLGVTTKYSETMSFSPDDFAANFNNTASLLSVTPAHVDKYMKAAESAVDAHFANTTLKARYFNCNTSQESCLRTGLTKFLLFAFRRPATDQELTRYVNIAKLSIAEGDASDVGAKLAMVGAMVSPHFLYRTILLGSPDDPKATQALSAYELASRMSYFIWSSMPDQALLDAAKNGLLATDAGITAEVKRMLKDTKSSALVDVFASQWVKLQALDGSNPSTATFPNYTPQLKADMREETRMFFRDLFTRDGSFFELLTAQHSFLNQRLATHYGISGVTSTTFSKVSLAGTERSGIVTQGAILMINANPDRTSIVRRGKWALDNLLCIPPPPPPPEVMGKLADGSTGATLREKLEHHRSDPNCYGCHAQMDPIGFALENFDAIGAYRSTDNGSALDTVGQFPDGRRFTGAKGLIDTVKEDVKFKTCVAEKIFTFSLGRLPEANDGCTINRIGVESIASDKPLSEAIAAMVLSDPFRKQRGADQ